MDIHELWKLRKNYNCPGVPRFQYLLYVSFIYGFKRMVHEVRSQQYERNAEPLPHVQHHTVFKGFLAGFYKLHKEAEGEYGSEAVAEIETGV